MNIGMIGVGLMGHSIAKHVQNAGHTLGFLVHSGNQPVDDLVGNGAIAHETIKSIMSMSETVILCVTGTPEVEECMQADGGILETAASNALVIDCSTSLPASTRKLSKLAEQYDVRFIDAAMTGTTKSAKDAAIGLLVGSRKTEFERALPIMDCFAKKILHVGPVGSGHQMKLLHNCVSLGWSAVLADVSASAKLAGVSPEMLAEVLENGAANGTLFSRIAPYLTKGDPSLFEFTINNSLKDLSYFHKMLQTEGRNSKLVEVIMDLYRDASEDSYGPRFVPELSDHLMQN